MTSKDAQAIIAMLEAETKRASKRLAEREDEYSLGYWSACFNILQSAKAEVNTP